MRVAIRIPLYEYEFFTFFLNRISNPARFCAWGCKSPPCALVVGRGSRIPREIIQGAACKVGVFYFVIAVRRENKAWDKTFPEKSCRIIQLIGQMIKSKQRDSRRAGAALVWREPEREPEARAPTNEST